MILHCQQTCRFPELHEDTVTGEEIEGGGD